MKCRNCEFVECAKCQTELVAHCPKCKANDEKMRKNMREVMVEFAPTLAKLAEGPREQGSSEEGGL